MAGAVSQWADLAWTNFATPVAPPSPPRAAATQVTGFPPSITGPFSAWQMASTIFRGVLATPDAAGFSFRRAKTDWRLDHRR